MPKANNQDNVEIGFIDPDDFVDFVPEARSEIMAENEAGEIPEEDEEFEYSPSEIIIEKPFKKTVDEDIVISKRRENTRGLLAMTYTLATFLIFIIGIIVSVVDGLHRDVSIVENLKEVLPLISGIFLGSLGFVLGYYFRKDEEQ